MPTVKPRGEDQLLELFLSVYEDRSWAGWICDTATFGTPREWVEFRREENGEHAESFAFYQGKLHSMGRNGIPVPL